MKTRVFLLLLTFFSISIFAQNKYTVDGNTYDLKTAVEGDIDLLWNSIDKQYRYFIKTNNGSISELLNTKNDSNKYKEEYKLLLADLTKNSNISTANLKFTLQDLKVFFKAYNTSVGHSVYPNETVSLKLRLAIFGGLTNLPFIENINNTTVPFFGTELEFVSSSAASNHAGFIGLGRSIDRNDFKYSATQITLGYRYRFINKSAFNIYGNVQLATYTFSKRTIALTNSTSEIVKSSAFKIPFIFGLGADIKVCKSNYITLTYNKLHALFVDNNGNFPVDFALGYRFNI